MSSFLVRRGAMPAVLAIRARSSAGDFPHHDAHLAARRRRRLALHCAFGRAPARQEPPMSTVTPNPSGRKAEDRRKALEQAEKNANPNQFREENEESKVVEIPPEKDKHPIGGLDPK
jgi:hypothetical protein